MLEQEPFLENLFQSLNDQSYLDVQTDDDIEIEYLVEDPTLLDTKDFNNTYVDARDQGRREISIRDIRQRENDRDRDRDGDHGGRELYTRDFNNRNKDARDNSNTRDRDRGRDDSRRRRPDQPYQSNLRKFTVGGRRNRDDDRQRHSTSRTRSPGSRRRNPRFQKDMGYRTSNSGEQKILIVNQIPEENCNIAEVHEYFSRFGNLIDCQVKPEMASAKLEFENHQEAMACYSSPDVIFNNRFVKVFWSSDEEAPG
jgi:hypothetical protein